MNIEFFEKKREFGKSNIEDRTIPYERKRIFINNKLSQFDPTFSEAHSFNPIMENSILKNQFLKEKRFFKSSKCSQFDPTTH